MFRGVIEVMYFVADRRAAADWYSRLLDLPISCLEDPEHFFIRVGGQDIWFLEADQKSPSGTGGQAAYWQVDDFDQVLERAQQMGAVLHRGPLDREDGTFMCQVKDPFGNALGLVGPRSRA
jgi:uncharacterized protein